jgi:hypothetical protein
MSKTNAVDVSIQAVEPESITGASSAAKAIDTGKSKMAQIIKRERNVIFI